MIDGYVTRREFMLGAIATTAGMAGAAAIARAGADSPAKASAAGGSLAVMKGGDIFARDNVMSWCFVYWDGKRRSPTERLEMLKRLGIKRVAYDGMAEQLPYMEQELELYKKHGIELVAFWQFNPKSLDLVKRLGLKPQLWVDMPERGGDQTAKVESAVKILEPLARQAKKAGCTLALYNHGAGWRYEPENQAQVIELLKTRGVDNVGICYCLFHGHHRLKDRKDFAAMFEKMKPYLWSLNLDFKIGASADEVAIYRIIRDSGWRGPVGIIGHDRNKDVEPTLRAALEGLKAVAEKLGDREAVKTYQ